MTTGPIKTSEEWLKIYQDDKPNFKILDPDGWDRANYHYSFHVEKITNLEFINRLLISTVRNKL